MPSKLEQFIVYGTFLASALFGDKTLGQQNADHLHASLKNKQLVQVLPTNENALYVTYNSSDTSCRNVSGYIEDTDRNGTYGNKGDKMAFYATQKGELMRHQIFEDGRVQTDADCWNYETQSRRLMKENMRLSGLLIAAVKNSAEEKRLLALVETNTNQSSQLETQQKRRNGVAATKGATAKNLFLTLDIKPEGFAFK